MASPNKELEFPQNSDEYHHWAKVAIFGVLGQGYANAMYTRSQMPEQHYVEAIQEQEVQPQHTQAEVARIIRESKPFIPANQVAASNMNDSVRIVEYPPQQAPQDRDMHTVAYIPSGVEAPQAESLPASEASAVDAAFQQVVDAYRFESGMAVTAHPEEASAAAVAPVEPQLTPLQQAERDFPNDRYFYGSTSVGDLRDQIKEIRDEAGES